MTTIDMRKIATLARAGLTDEQIDQVCALFPAAAPPTAPPPEPADSAAEQHSAETDLVLCHRRNHKARAAVLAFVARGPCKIADLARQAYGDDSKRNIKCVTRLVHRLAEDGLVETAGERVSLANGQSAAPSQNVTRPMQSVLPIAAPASKGPVPDAKHLRLAAVIELCGAIRSDVVRAGGKVTATLSTLVAPHLRLLDATCIGLGRTSNIALVQTIVSRPCANGSYVLGGLKFTKGREVRSNSGPVTEWAVSAV